MLKGRGKGKISNDLVAASCAAVLAVYAAGYSRTREAARRFETQAKERRTASVQESPAPRAAPEHEVVAATAAATVVAPQPTSSAVARKPTRKKAESSKGV